MELLFLSQHKINKISGGTAHFVKRARGGSSHSLANSQVGYIPFTADRRSLLVVIEAVKLQLAATSRSEDFQDQPCQTCHRHRPSQSPSVAQPTGLPNQQRSIGPQLPPVDLSLAARFHLHGLAPAPRVCGGPGGRAVPAADR